MLAIRDLVHTAIVKGRIGQSLGADQGHILSQSQIHIVHLVKSHPYRSQVAVKVGVAVKANRLLKFLEGAGIEDVQLNVDGCIIDVEVRPENSTDTREANSKLTLKEETVSGSSHCILNSARKNSQQLKLKI